MQEGPQTVEFQPIYEGHVPWFVNLFVIYLFCVLLMTVVRTVRLMWTLRKHRKAQEREVPPESSSQSFLEICYSEIRSIRNFSHLTFLLAAVVLCWSVTNILAGVAAVKVACVPCVAARLADALIPFLMGLIFSSAQFSCAMFLESRVRRRRLMLDLKAIKPQPPVE